MSLKIPGLMRFVSLATWKTSTEPSASSWRVRDDRAQNVPAVTPPTLEKEKHFHLLTVIITGNAEQAGRVLLIVDHSRAVLAAGLLFHQVQELKGVADGTVRVRPAGGAVVFHLQDVVILTGRREIRCLS